MSQTREKSVVEGAVLIAEPVALFAFDRVLDVRLIGEECHGDPEHATGLQFRAHVQVGTGTKREDLDEPERVRAGERGEEGQGLDRTFFQGLGDRLHTRTVV